ncbi:MAG: glycosyltransferase family 2 protein [Paludibacteraceae bacterium]|nr:glycosyltransferase family 2 protein [Paludibacteraceae bacterium]
MTPPITQFLSVIICTYNREKYIGNLLESIANNTLPKSEYEILLVDNNCTDNTHQVCADFAAAHQDINFRYLVEPEQGLSAARNKGIREAKGDILVYVDDDALVDVWYLDTFAYFFKQNPTIDAAGGPIIPLYETQEPKWMTRYTKELLCGYLYFGDAERDFPNGRYPGGGNAAYRAEVFKKIGLFNTALGRKGNNLMGAEEKDIFDKMQSQNMKFRYLPKAILHHIIPQKKLEQDYFDRLTHQIGQSERQRTLDISKSKYAKRLFSEFVKWCGTLVLAAYYTLCFTPQKGWKLILFRRNVTRGLLGR